MILEYLRKQTWEFYFEWVCTVVLIAGVVLTSFNIYPLNIWVLLIGNIGWVALGWIWRKWSLIILQTLITIIYIAGVIKTLI